MGGGGGVGGTMAYVIKPTWLPVANQKDCFNFFFSLTQWYQTRLPLSLEINSISVKSYRDFSILKKMPMM